MTIIRLSSYIGVCTLAIITAGCYQSSVDQGVMLSAQQINSIHKGQTKKKVTQLLGHPVLVNPYKNNTRTYVHSKVFIESEPDTVQSTTIAFKDTTVSAITHSIGHYPAVS